MDIDENDLLFSNQFIPYPNVEKEVSSQSNEEFKKFYEKEQSLQEEKTIRENLEKISIKNFNLNEETDDQNLLNTNSFQTENLNNNQTFTRRIKQVVTYINVDSRDRNKSLYPKASYFKIFLGKTFYNVKSIKLSSMEFPNTNAVINSYNNKIYWRNQEDIDNNIINNITKEYPIYSTTLRIGSYIATTIQSEISNKLALVKRQDNNSDDYHYFVVHLDLDTDVVTFTSLILTQLNSGSLSTIENSGIITVRDTGHSFKEGDQVYLVGAQTIGGITSQTLNTLHTVTFVSADEFQFEVNIKASQTIDRGGGNTLKSGVIAPFQFLFGDYPDTVAQNLGFPLENSSQLIKTHIKSVETIYLVLIETTTPHGLDNTFKHIGKPCTISGTNTNPNLNGNRTIVRVINRFSFLVLSSNLLNLIFKEDGQTVSFDNSLIDHSGTYDIQNISNYNFDTLLLTTFTDHNYDVPHIGSNITFYETQTVPNLDGTHTIDAIVSSNEFIILESILQKYETNTIGQGGYISRNHPITTHTLNITGITSGSITYISHDGININLLPNDKIILNNVISTPNLNGIHSISTIPNSNTLTLNYSTINASLSNDTNNPSYIGTGLHKVSFPYHGFNNITTIQNTSGSITITGGSTVTYNNLFVVQTQLPHGFSENQQIRISQTQTFSNIDLNTGHTILELIDDDEFVIGTNTVPLPPDTIITSGIIGYNQNFKLYNISDVGGIKGENFNNKQFSIRNILDENSFTFYSNNNLASYTESGGGSSAYISSLIHGFNGIQTNLKDNILNRSINLQGENYSFLCCPQLSTMLNTGNVENIFARIILDQSPGSMVFSYLSNPKTFDNIPLDKLEDLEFSMLNYDGTYYEFNDLDYSFTLQITENIDVTDSFNISSKRGIVDNNSSLHNV